MRPVDSRLIPDGMLAVLTVKELDEESTVQMADFTDMHALSHQGKIIGMSNQGYIYYGLKPCFMKDGVWLTKINPNYERIYDIQPTFDEWELDLLT